MIEITEEVGFRGLWIPKEILQDKNLTFQEKGFLSQILALDNKDGCFAGNTFFSELFDISKTRVSLVINSLVKKGYISSEIIYREGSKEILNRVLTFCYIGYPTNVIEGMQGKLNPLYKESLSPYPIKVKPPIQGKLKDKTNIKTNIKTKDKEVCRFAPPTPDEVRSYCLERKNTIDPERFVDFYSCKGWMVGKNKMKDWKSAVRNWERREKEVYGQNRGSNGEGEESQTEPECCIDTCKQGIPIRADENYSF